MPSMDEPTATRGDETTGHKGLGASQGYPADPYRLRRALLEGKSRLIGAGVVGVVVGFLWVKLMMTSRLRNDRGPEVRRRSFKLPVLRTEQEHALAPAADALRRQSVSPKDRRGDSVRRKPDDAQGRDRLSRLTWMSNTVRDHGSGSTQGRTRQSLRPKIVTDVFMTYHKERQSRRIEAEIASVGSKRIDAAEDQAEVARRLYNEFREEHGIADLSTEQRSMVQSAAKLRADSELARVGDSGPRSPSQQPRNTAGEHTQKRRYRLAASPGEGDVQPAAPGVGERESYALARVTPVSKSLEQQVDQLRFAFSFGLEAARASVRRRLGVGINTTYQVVEGQLRDSEVEAGSTTGTSEGARRDGRQGTASSGGVLGHRGGSLGALLAEVKVNENMVSGNLRRDTKAALEDAIT